MPTQKELVNKLVEDVDALKVDVSSLKVKFATPPTVENAPTQVTPTQGTSDYFPVPPDFIDTVDLVLNKNFVVRCEPLTDSPSFKFTIVVPEKYSSMTPAQKEMIHEDARVKVINNSDGVNGVRLWAEKVYETFDSDTKFRVIEDRPFAQRPL